MFRKQSLKSISQLFEAAGTIATKLMLQKPNFMKILQPFSTYGVVVGIFLISLTACHTHADYPDGEKLAEQLDREYELILSPNFDNRKYKNSATHKREGDFKKPTILVLHYTACEKNEAKELFNKKDNVSAHYLVDREGNISQFVPEDQRAWHAGHGYWRGEEDVNTVSIGIETINLGFKVKEDQPNGERVRGDSEEKEWYKYDQELLKTLAPLCKNIIDRHNIKPQNIIGHSDMATNRGTNHLGRKVDPGPLFPWERLYNEYGIGAWYDLNQPLKNIQLPKDQEEHVAWVQENLLKYGYLCPQTKELDEGTTRAVKAFQMHFRPTNISGEIDKETINILAHLVDKYC